MIPIEIPDDMHARLVTYARLKKSTPEAIVRQLIENTIGDVNSVRNKYMEKGKRYIFPQPEDFMYKDGRVWIKFARTCNHAGMGQNTSNHKRAFRRVCALMRRPPEYKRASDFGEFSIQQDPQFVEASAGAYFHITYIRHHKMGPERDEGERKNMQIHLVIALIMLLKEIHQEKLETLPYAVFVEQIWQLHSTPAVLARAQENLIPYSYTPPENEYAAKDIEKDAKKAASMLEDYRYVVENTPPEAPAKEYKGNWLPKAVSAELPYHPTYTERFKQPPPDKHRTGLTQKEINQLEEKHKEEQDPLLRTVKDFADIDPEELGDWGTFRRVPQYLKDKYWVQGSDDPRAKEAAARAKEEARQNRIPLDSIGFADDVFEDDE